MQFNDFVKEVLGTYIDFDGVYGNQCVDLIKEYVEKVLGIDAWVSNAENYATTYPKSKFDLIENTPDGVPEQGDIVIFNDSVGEFGHVCIAFSGGSVDEFKSLDQNWPKGSPIQVISHNYRGVIGWLRPKSDAPAGSSETTPVVQDSGVVYRVHKNDTLSKIAQTFLGDGSRWGEVFALNRDQIDDPNLIFAGTVIKLPKK